MSRVKTQWTKSLPIIGLSFTLLSAVHVQAADAHKGHGAAVPSEPPAMKPKETAAEVKGSLIMPRVFFISPKDGETVSPEFTVKFGLEGMKISPAGKVVLGTGHHHLIVDGQAVAKGQVVPADDTHLHFGKGQTESKLKLSPGPHTLTLQFADGSHKSYGEPMSQTIHITVKGK